MASIDLFGEIGAAGVTNWEGRVTDRYLHSLRGPSGLAEMAKILRKEPAAFTVNRAITLTARQAEWSAVTDGTSAADVAAAEFVNACLLDMSHSLWSSIRFALSAQAFGFSDLYVVYKRRLGPKPRGTLPASAYNDGRIGIKKLAVRRQETIDRWIIDENGGPQAMIQIDPQNGREFEPVPIERLLHFIGGDDRGSWEGIGWLEPAYKLHHMISNFEILKGIGHQRSHVGLPIFRYKSVPDLETKTNIRALGRGLVANEKQYVTVPSNIVDFELGTVTNSNAAELREEINQLRWEIMSLAMAQFLRLGSTASGSRALADPLITLFRDSVTAALDDVAAVFNRHLIPRLMAANPDMEASITAMPRLTHSGANNLPIAVLDFLDTIHKFLIDPPAGLEDANWLREAVGMPPITDLPEVSIDRTKDQPAEASADLRRLARAQQLRLHRTASEFSEAARLLAEVTDGR